MQVNCLHLNLTFRGSLSARRCDSRVQSVSSIRRTVYNIPKVFRQIVEDYSGSVKTRQMVGYGGLWWADGGLWWARGGHEKTPVLPGFGGWAG